MSTCKEVDVILLRSYFCEWFVLICSDILAFRLSSVNQSLSEEPSARAHSQTHAHMHTYTHVHVVEANFPVPSMVMIVHVDFFYIKRFTCILQSHAQLIVCENEHGYYFGLKHHCVCDLYTRNIQYQEEVVKQGLVTCWGQQG